VANHYTYRVSWSQDDGEHVATCAEFPSLSWLDSDEIEAIRGIKDLVHSVIEDMRANNEPVPEAIADRTYSGNLTLRVPPELHRRLALEAAEAHISLSRHLNCKLASA
jgi:predicted HicB family RNase H-like nuclease